MLRVLPILSAAAILAPALPGGPIYSVTDLGGLGGAQSTAYRITESGQSAGWAQSAAGVSQAVTHTGGTISVLGAGESQAGGLNSAGAVVGSTNGLGQSSAMLWQNGSAVNLGTLGGPDSWAMDINDAGQIVGSSSTAAGDGRAFLYENGQMKDLGTLPGGGDTNAVAINGSGQVAGWSLSNTGVFQGFLWTPGKGMKAVGGPGSYAMDVNDLGQVAGHQRTGSGGLHAFLYSDGITHDLGTLGGAISFGYGVNRWGQVVGYSWTADGICHAFLYIDGVMLDLNALLPDGDGWELLEAYGINDAGQIVGSGRLNGQVRAFRLDPLALPAEEAGAPLPNPEPSTWILVVLGISFLGWQRIRRIRRNFAHLIYPEAAQ
jgi:probable HAF family extracellular repeat protein